MKFAEAVTHIALVGYRLGVRIVTIVRYRRQQLLIVILRAVGFFLVDRKRSDRRRRRFDRRVLFRRSAIGRSSPAKRSDFCGRISII